MFDICWKYAWYAQISCSLYIYMKYGWYLFNMCIYIHIHIHSWYVANASYYMVKKWLICCQYMVSTYIQSIPHPTHDMGVQTTDIRGSMIYIYNYIYNPLVQKGWSYTRSKCSWSDSRIPFPTDHSLMIYGLVILPRGPQPNKNWKHSPKMWTANMSYTKYK